MKFISAEFEQQLSGSAVSLCYCWEIQFNDGASLGFTDHDCDIVSDTTLFHAVPGLTAPQFDTHLGFNVDSFDVFGAIDSDYIIAEELRAGRYQDAIVILSVRNWQSPSDHVELVRGRVSDVRESGGRFEVELRQYTDQFETVKGRVFSAMCDTPLGSPACGVDLTSEAFFTTGTIIDVLSSSRINLDIPSNYPSGWFDLGLISLKSFPFWGREISILVHKQDSNIANIELWAPLPVMPEIGSEVSLTAGCDHRLSTCASKFSNEINFQGFPFIPGVSYATS